MDPRDLHAHLERVCAALDSGLPLPRPAFARALTSTALCAALTVDCTPRDTGEMDTAPLYAAVQVETACDDLLDNDDDGVIDCDDWDCASDQECSSAPTDEVCDDEVDNDGDGYVDCDDWDCTAEDACTAYQAPEICDDGFDNDGDTWVDCDDWDCADDPACGE